MAYLIGVDRVHYEGDGGEPGPQIAVYEKLELNKNTRIIRNLCMIRNGIEKHYTAISRAFIQDFKNIGSVPEYIPPAP